ncbi:ComEC family competence protein [Formosa maritima]|uniref:ComEC family competence protein n=1 Tax=Formosa maritima TaxID=2592046 RepID=A0A5D0G3U3_9FLAO|nr:ComEC family competence protein [Formosa maritima]
MVIGILLSHYFTVSLSLSIVTTLILFFVLVLVYLISKTHFLKNIWFGIIAFLTMISIGILVVNIHDHRNFKNHYSHLKNFKSDSTSYITIKISDQLKSNIYNDKYVVNILSVDNIQTTGLALLNIKVDSISKPFSVDDVLIINSKIYSLIEPLNPNQFNYKSFLENKNIYSKLYTNNESLYIVSKKKTTLFGLADAFRSTINLKLKKYHFTLNELSIINALLLGQRKEISNEIYEDYKRAGAIHILAVSGLHVGIILLFLNYLFKPIEFIKHGHIYKIILILICLWSFAVIAGLSASVSRAATMFTFVTIGMNLKRPINTLNTLACSAFILLLIRPSFLFDVGFQLSYFAVIGIVTFYPFFYRLWKPKYWIADKLWQAFVVSIAAQFGILPISLFYFHQFPGLFILSNVIVVPVLGIILSFGLVVIGLALLNILPNLVALIYGIIISWMNNFFKWIAQQEAFYFKDIPFNFIDILASYLFIFAFYQFYKIKSYKNAIAVLFTIIIFQSVQIYSKQQYQSINRFIIFQKNKQTLIGIQNGEKMSLHHNIKDFNKELDFIISNFTIKNNISFITEDTIQSVYKISDKNILVIDSLGLYEVSSFKPDYILLRNSPKINLVRVIDSINPKLIIADGSNYKSYLKRWEETCQKQKIPFHQTNEKGAFIIE